MSYRRGGGGRTVCQFFLEGRCRFGDGCKNEHPRSQQTQQQSFNKFGPLQNNGSGGGGQPRGNDRNRPGDNRNVLPFGLNRDLIRADVTSGGADGERPSWPMSCYAPGRDAPRQLIEGPEYEISPEEVRMLYYLAKASGDIAQIQAYEQNERAAAAKAEQAVQEISNDPDRFIRLIIDGEKVHPNRIDETVKASAAWQRPPRPQQPQGFGAPSQSSPFSQAPAPAAISMSKPPFGAQPMAPSGFGAPSALGSRPATFGAPSSIGNQAPAFGAPSLPGATTSPFGAQRPQQQQPPSSGFGAPSSGFGAPSALGNNVSPFSSQGPPASAGFGQPSALGTQLNQPSPFVQNNASPFANPAPTSASPFGQNTTQLAPSGGPQTHSGFGQPSGSGGFGNPNRSSPFAQAGGQDNINKVNTNPFGQPSPNRPPVSEPKQTTTNIAAAPNASVNAYTTRRPDGTIATWKGERVSWINPRTDKTAPPVPTIHNTTYGKPERIWLPDGPPATANPDAEGPSGSYEGELGTELQGIYEWVREKGEFKNGLMPEIPPKQEWIRWDV